MLDAESYLGEYLQQQKKPRKKRTSILNRKFNEGKGAFFSHNSFIFVIQEISVGILWRLSSPHCTHKHKGADHKILPACWGLLDTSFIDCAHTVYTHSHNTPISSMTYSKLQDTLTAFGYCTKTFMYWYNMYTNLNKGCICQLMQHQRLFITKG